MFCLILFLSFSFQITFGQVGQLANLNVSCDENGIQVRVNFDSFFNGIIYSKGYYKNNNCRYVQEGSNQTNFEFKIYSDSCGTEKVFTDKKSQTMENILIIQNDPIFQEQADLARLVACRYSSAKVPDLMHRRVIFKPYMIDNLEVISIPMQDDEGNNRKIDLWMDITLGVFPNTENLEGPVKVGDNLTLSIYVKDTENDTDIRIKDCYAYDNMKSAKNNQKPAQLQLSEENGCPLREQLLSIWSRTYKTMDTGASIIAFNNLKAFKFPERDSVFLACNIDLCKENCTERCELEAINPDEESQQNVEENNLSQNSNQFGDGNDYDDPNTIDSSSLGYKKSIGVKKEKTQIQKNLNFKNPQFNQRNLQPNFENTKFDFKNLQSNSKTSQLNLKTQHKNQIGQTNRNHKLKNQQNNLKPPLQNIRQYQSQSEHQFDLTSQELDFNDGTKNFIGKSVNGDLFQQSSMSENSIAKKNTRRKSNKNLASVNKQFGPAKKFNSQINFNQQSPQVSQHLPQQKIFFEKQQLLEQKISKQQQFSHQEQQIPQQQFPQQQIPQQQIPQQQFPQQQIPQQQIPQQQIPQQQILQQQILQKQISQQQNPQQQILQQQILQKQIPQQQFPQQQIPQQQFPQQQFPQQQFPQQQILQQQNPQQQNPQQQILQQQNPQQQIPQQQIPQQQIPQQQIPQQQILQKQISQQQSPQQQFPQQQQQQFPQQEQIKQQSSQIFQQNFDQPNQLALQNNQKSNVKRKVIRKKINQKKENANINQSEISNLSSKNEKSLSFLDTNSLPLESPKPFKPLVIINNSDLSSKNKELIITDAISSAKIAATLAASQPKLSQLVLDPVKSIKNSNFPEIFGTRQSKQA